MKVKTGMLYHMNNTFEKATFQTSVDVFLMGVVNMGHTMS